MATRPKAEPANSGGGNDKVLRAILLELQALSRAVAEIAAGLPAASERDPGDAVPPGVAVQSPAPLTPADKKVRRALERMPRQRKGGESKA